MGDSRAVEMRKRVENIYARMSVEERVGQLFILAFPGKKAEVIFDIIDQYGLGGCYISQDNAETSAEAKELSRALQTRMRQKQQHPQDAQSPPQSQQEELPLILGVDQEGAWGVLIPEATIGPGNLALGTSEDTQYTSVMYGIFAQEMKAAGYQAILGPCADINLDPRNPIIGTRSFGEDAQRVLRHVSAAVQAVRSWGLLTAAKHFPGHGDTHSDTHRDIPIVDKTMELLLQQELLPFQAAIDAGVDMVMTSHILFPQVDAQFPATLSKTILTELLRERMKFRGLIITDSMNMGAIRRHYSPEEASVMAFLAGADLIMLSEEHYDHSAAYLEKQRASIEGILAAVRSGRIPEAVLQDRVLRILQTKLDMQSRQVPQHTEGCCRSESSGSCGCSEKHPSPAKGSESSGSCGCSESSGSCGCSESSGSCGCSESSGSCGCSESSENCASSCGHEGKDLALADRKRIELEAAKHAVKVLRNNFQLLPLKKEYSIAVVNTTPRTSYANLMNARGIGPNQAKPAYDSFTEELRTHWANAQYVSHEHLRENIETALEGYDRIIAITEDYPLPGEDFAKGEQQAMVQLLITRYADRLVVVGLRSPYELEQYPDLNCYVSTYSSRTCSAVAAAELLSSGATH